MPCGESSLLNGEVAQLPVDEGVFRYHVAIYHPGREGKLHWYNTSTAGLTKTGEESTVLTYCHNGRARDNYQVSHVPYACEGKASADIIRVSRIKFGTRVSVGRFHESERRK